VAKTESEWVTIDDTNIVAYLHYCGFRFSPFKKGNDGRIGFKVYGEIDATLASFYDNNKVGIQDYVACLKKVRGSMFLIKGMGESETEQLKLHKED
jgi:hypothetical protein